MARQRRHAPRRFRGLARKLVWRIWLALLATLVLFALIAALLWHAFGWHAFVPTPRLPAELIAQMLPPRDAPPAAVAAALAHWQWRFRSDLALFDADGLPIAATADNLPPPRPGLADEDFSPSPRGPVMTTRLADGRWLVARRRHGFFGQPVGFFAVAMLLAFVVAVGAYPVARRLTSRLERLQIGVERLGQGDLAARVPVQGHDEVARLAESFNSAAERIESLVQSHRSLLANASHELRSPLTRIRMAVELLQAQPSKGDGGDGGSGDCPNQTGAAPAAQAVQSSTWASGLRRDIAELDELIDEILLAARLDATTPAAAASMSFESIDLTGLAAEEAARVGAHLDAVPVELDGDARLLRRLLRNLLENAQRYGGQTPIDVSIQADATHVEIRVCDRGPGVPATERERVFEPFYRAAGASEARGGVGLGLALVRKVAQQHGGTARCEARDGGGSCFVAQLPRRSQGYPASS